MLQKSSIMITAGIFFVNPTKKNYLMDISRKIGLSHTSVKKNLDELVKLGLVIESVEKKGARKFPIYKANIDNRLFKDYKIIYRKISMIKSQIIVIVSFILSST